MATVQIKRKRGQDPLEALMIQDQRSSSLIFRLAGTFDSAVPDTSHNITLQESKDASDQRIFKRRKADSPKPEDQKQESEPDKEAELNPLLQEMVNQYIDAEAEDYVYDIYFGSKNPKLVSGTKNMGYIVLDEEDKLIFEHENYNDSDEVYTDDEDSNAEDFYRNDYPEDEDEGLSSLDDFDELRLSDDHEFDVHEFEEDI